MISLRMGATQWARLVKRAGALLCAAGGMGLLSGGCGPTPVAPHGFVAATILQGDTGVCALPDDPGVVAVGMMETTVPTGNGINISCTVSSAGGGAFHVQASASNGNGTFTIQGTMSADPTVAQTGIVATFSAPGIGYGNQNGGPSCTVSFTAISGEPSAVGAMGIAAGRVWGNLTCPTLTSSAQQDQCEGIAEFKFEDCGS